MIKEHETGLTPGKITTLQNILSRDSLEFALLYGSRATGTYNEKSDIDIGVKSSKNNNEYTILFRIEEEYSDKGFDDNELDLTILDTTIDETFKNTVKTKAIYICGNKSKYNEFISS